MLYAIVALLVIVLDQWTKLWVATNHDMLPRTLIEGVVTIVEAKNTGGAFSFLAGQNMTVFFIAAAGVMALVTIILLSTNLVKGGLGRWSLVFISAGGLSNALDRLLSDGAVTDMIKLDFLEKLKINFPVFNVADIFISVFCVMLILYVLFGGRRKAEDEDEAEDEEEEEEEEDLEDEEEEDLPRRRNKQRRSEPEPEQPKKKSRQSYEEEYERYKARKAQEAPAPAPAPEAAAPAVDPGDPFAEWERANRKVGRPAPSAAPAPAPAPVVEEAPAPAPAPVVEAPKPAPAPAPAPKPAAPKPAAEEEFSLEDILAEFK